MSDFIETKVIEVTMKSGDVIRLKAYEADGKEVVFEGTLLDPHFIQRRGEEAEISFRIRDYIMIMGNGPTGYAYDVVEKP